METKNAFLASCLIMVTMLFSNLPAKAQNERVSSIDIQASAEREVMPDELVISIHINENEYKGKTSLQEKQKELISVLKANKINYEEDLSIKQMGSTATFKLFSKNPVPRTDAVYYLKLYDAATLQQVVQQLEEKKITNIHLIQTRYTKKDELKLELGMEAVKKAKMEAEALAKAIGQNIGKAFSINSWMSNDTPRPYNYRMVMASDKAEGAEAAQNAETPKVTGIKYTVNVSAKFILE